VKDYPKWFDGGTCNSNVTLSKRRASTSNHGPGVESADTTSNLHSAQEMAGSAWQGARPTRTKVAKEAQKNLKVKEATAYKQAKATELLAEAALRKTALIEEHNLILLMTATDAQGQPSATATEFLALRQKEELQKLKARLKLQEAAEEARVQSELEQAARERVEAAAEELANNETRRQVKEAAASGGNTSGLDETRCNDDVLEDGEDEDTDILGFQSSGGQAGAGVGSGGGGSQFEFASPPPVHHFDVGDQPSQQQHYASSASPPDWAGTPLVPNSCFASIGNGLGGVSGAAGLGSHAVASSFGGGKEGLLEIGYEVQLGMKHGGLLHLRM
jgi:hypothetical protein